MPTYKFFEAKKSQTIREPQFEQFNLKTIERSKSRTKKTMEDNVGELDEP